MPQPTATHKQLIALLRPLVETEADRRALVESAFYPSDLPGQIDYSGSANAFSYHLLKRVLAHGTIGGRRAVHLLLDAMAEQYGDNRRAELETVRQHVDALSAEDFSAIKTTVRPRFLISGVIAVVVLAVAGVWATLGTPEAVTAQTVLPTATAAPPTDEPRTGDVTIGEGNTIIDSPIVTGDLTNIDNFIGQVTINAGDTPAEREQKRLATIDYYAGVLLQNLTSVDGMLGQVQAVAALWADDPVDDAIATARPSALEEAVGDAYDDLIRGSDIAQLRANLNTYELIEVPLAAPLLTHVEAETFTLTQINRGIADVDQALDQLFAVLEADPVDDADWQQWQADRLDLAVRRLENRAQTLQLNTLLALYALEEQAPGEVAIPGDVFLALPAVPEDEVVPRLEAVLAEATAIVAENEALVARGREIVEGAAEDLDPREALAIQPDDPWFVVSANAIVLRQLGYTAEALDTFAIYGEMFAASDPTAPQYARTARALTRQFEALGLTDGAAYIHTVLPDSPAAAGGLAAGDVVIAVDGVEVRNNCDLAFALPSATAPRCVELEPDREKPDTGNTFTVTILRLGTDGTFSRETLTLTLPAGETLLGIGYMPI